MRLRINEDAQKDDRIPILGGFMANGKHLIVFKVKWFPDSISPVFAPNFFIFSHYCFISKIDA